jgi:hypothetical protein
LIEHLLGRPTWHGRPPRLFAAGPTRDQAKRIYWDDLKSLMPRKAIGSISESELRISAISGGQIWVQGLDVPQRIEGTPWDGAIIDELANCRPGTWDHHIRPSLADRKGWAWLIGVPDMDAPGQVEYEAMVQLALSGDDPEWACFSWPSADILPPEEIESARRRLDPRIFEQEYLGKFIIARGRAFAEFDPNIHVKSADYDPSLHLCWSLDFNINPMCSGVIQHDGNLVRVIDELTLPDTSTNDACSEFLRRAERNGWNLKDLHVYGDASGNCRDSTSGTSDWIIIRNRLKDLNAVFKVPRANPAVKDTINALRSKLKNAAGQSSLIIDPRCGRLIEDLRTTIWPGSLDEQHALAWMRYFVVAEYAVRFEQSSITGTISFST